MTPQEKLNQFIKNHTIGNDLDGSLDISITEQEQPEYFQLVADTLPENQQKEYILENEYSRLWNMLDTAKFDNDYQKDQITKNLFAWKVCEYQNDLMMTYIQNKLNLTDDQTNDLYDDFFNQALELTRKNDNKHLAKLQKNVDDLKNLDTNIKIKHFGQIYGFELSNKKLDLDDKSNNTE